MAKNWKLEPVPGKKWKATAEGRTTSNAGPTFRMLTFILSRNPPNYTFCEVNNFLSFFSEIKFSNNQQNQSVGMATNYMFIFNLSFMIKKAILDLLEHFG